MKINETFAPAKKGTAKIAIQISDLVVQRVRAEGQLLKILTSRMVCSLSRFIISSAEVIVVVHVIQVISLVDLLVRYNLLFHHSMSDSCQLTSPAVNPSSVSPSSFDRCSFSASSLPYCW